MTTEVNKYRIWCIEEGTNVCVWSENEPTICPNDHPDKTIDTAQTVILETLNVNHVKVEEDTDGYFESMDLLINIPTGTPGDVTEHDITWDMDILLWKTILTPTADMIGDSISVLAAPEKTVGVLTAPVSIGDTVLNVNSTVTDNIWRGFLVTVDDGVNKDVLGRCTNVDSVGGTITVKTPTTYAYSSGVPVKISVYVLQDIYISDTNKIVLGDKGFKGKTIDKDVIVRIYYTNNSGTSKEFRWRIECYNNG